MYNNCCIRGTAGSDGAGKRFSIVKLPGGVDTVPPAVWQKAGYVKQRYDKIYTRN